jgi:CelD/BcsL family acetyltransferase involved in cellulose biosynthesis
MQNREFPEQDSGNAAMIRQRQHLATRFGVAELNAAEHVIALTATARTAAVPSERRGAPVQALELTTDLITSVEGIAALAPDYARLHQLTGNTLPFTLPEWHLSWCRHFLHSNPHIRDQPLFCVLRNRSGECVAIVPLILTRRRIGPLKLATVDLLGADPGLTEIRTPLIEPGFERPAVRAVHASLSRLGGWDWIHWHGLTGPLAEALALESAPRWHRCVEDYVLDLPPSWAELRAALKRNIRESLRHCYNSLKRDGHAFELIVARAPAEIRRALPRFLELHALRADMAWGAKHPDRFATRSLQDFLYDVCESLAARDVVRVFQLRIGTQIVAARLAFVVADSLYLYYSGFDPAWARYSVMTTTVAEVLKYAIANRLKTVNLSPTGEQSKLRWRPRRVEFHTALVQREALRSRLACGAYRVAMSRQGMPAQVLKSLLSVHRNRN